MLVSDKNGCFFHFSGDFNFRDGNSLPLHPLTSGAVIRLRSRLRIPIRSGSAPLQSRSWKMKSPEVERNRNRKFSTLLSSTASDYASLMFILHEIDIWYNDNQINHKMAKFVPKQIITFCSTPFYFYSYSSPTPSPKTNHSTSAPWQLGTRYPKPQYVGNKDEPNFNTPSPFDFGRAKPKPKKTKTFLA